MNELTVLRKLISSITHSPFSSFALASPFLESSPKWRPPWTRPCLGRPWGGPRFSSWMRSSGVERLQLHPGWPSASPQTHKSFSSRGSAPASRHPRPAGRQAAFPGRSSLPFRGLLSPIWHWVSPKTITESEDQNVSS